MERAIRDLCQLGDQDLFREIETGIRHLIGAVDRLDDAAKELHKTGRHHAARIIGMLQTEEAAKVLILLDVVRCPLNEQNDRARTADYFYNHLAKNIYVEVCNWSPVDFLEVKDGVELERQEYYLDGPNYVDWIFPNDIIQRREDATYVGYIRADSPGGSVPERYWNVLSDAEGLGFHGGVWSVHKVACIARALHELNITSKEGLAVVAEIWRPFHFSDETPWHEFQGKNLQMLQVLNEHQILARDQNAGHALVQESWIFPLWQLDLTEKPVKKRHLRERQQQWAEH